MSGLPNKEPLDWIPECDAAFNKIQYLMAADALAAYPDHNMHFNIFTDALDFQVGACIMQGGRIVAYYSKKLNKAQKSYTTMEKEIISIAA
eukprot:4018441-Ditylum_brightwellii.AAC.1